MSSYYHLSSYDFAIWLNQEIWINGAEKEPRKYCLYEFADALTKFMKSHGYRMDIRWGTGRTVITNWLYRLSVRVKVGEQRQLRPSVIAGEIHHRCLPEDFDRFHCVVGSIEIMNFMEAWSLIEDFDTSLPLGQAVQSELEILLWSYLDLDESEQGAIVLEMLEQESSDSEDHHARRGRAVAARVDEYIQDAAEGYHGGVGYKV